VSGDVDEEVEDLLGELTDYDEVDEMLDDVSDDDVDLDELDEDGEVF
jgi:hypothetical protein